MGSLCRGRQLRRQLRPRLTLLANSIVLLAAWQAAGLGDAGHEALQHAAALDNLGVRKLTPVYAIIPHTADGRKNATVVLSVWLRRIGQAGGACELPHQARDTIRLTAWADDPADLHLRKYGHLWLPVGPDKWQPQFLLETEAPGPVLEAKLETTAAQLRKVPEPPLRPFSFRFDLPKGVGNCFKLIERSYPRHKMSICLPPAATEGLCKSLAPPQRHTTATPALWMAIGPVRHMDSIREWGPMHNDIAVRLMHYVSYHVAMGASGLLLYADELNRNYLRQHPVGASMVNSGVLRFVHWDMPERGHDVNDGRGRVLGYNYDQALVAAHAMLGLSACGTNLALLITDLDEYLYSPKPNVRWPAPFAGCMHGGGGGDGGRGGGGGVAMHALSRIELLTSMYTANQEPGLWAAAALAGKGGRGGMGGEDEPATVSEEGFMIHGSGGGRSGPVHPLVHYDLISKEPMKARHNKPVVLPAAEVVAFFVHEGAPLQLQAYRPVGRDCLVLLHVPNYFRRRTKTIHYVPLNLNNFQHFEHWLLINGGGDTLATQWLPHDEAPAGHEASGDGSAAAGGESGGGDGGGGSDGSGSGGAAAAASNSTASGKGNGNGTVESAGTDAGDGGAGVPVPAQGSKQEAAARRSGRESGRRAGKAGAEARQGGARRVRVAAALHGWPALLVGSGLVMVGCGLMVPVLARLWRSSSTGAQKGL